MIDFSQTKKYRNELFPISYYKDVVEDNNQLKDILVPVILENSKKLKDQQPKGWLTNKIMTSFSGEPPGQEIFFGENRYFQSILEKRYSKCLDNFFDDYYEIRVNQLWYNCYLDGEYQEAHEHVGDIFCPTTFACIHFLSFDKTRHKPVCFYDPISDIRCTASLEFGSHEYQDPKFLDINEGDFIMFPSFLRHSVYPSIPTLDYPRITIAFNIFVSKYGGKKVVY